MYRAGILVACGAAIVVGVSTKDATAQPWRGVKSIVTASENMQWIAPVACNRDERCVKGRHWRYGKCIPC
jgi:hypothetical protein